MIKAHPDPRPDHNCAFLFTPCVGIGVMRERERSSLAVERLSIRECFLRRPANHGTKRRAAGCSKFGYMGGRGYGGRGVRGGMARRARGLLETEPYLGPLLLTSTFEVCEDVVYSMGEGNGRGRGRGRGEGVSRRGRKGGSSGAGAKGNGTKRDVRGGTKEGGKLGGRG